MIEVEIKLPLKERILTESELLKQGFSRGDLVKETDIYFNGKEHDFKKCGEAFRIRQIENQSAGTASSVITFKGKKTDRVFMTRKELETGIEDPDICKEIFSAIGFEPMRPVVKQRQYYHQNCMTACLDQVEGLGDFLELEILVDREEQKDAAQERIASVLETLGYSMADTVRRSYLSMLQEKQEKSELSERLL